MSTADKDILVQMASEVGHITAEDLRVTFPKLGPTDIILESAVTSPTLSTNADLPPTPQPSQPNSVQRSIPTDPPIVYPSLDQGSPQPDRNADGDCGVGEDNKPPSAPLVTSHDENETKTEADPVNEPPLSQSPPFPSPATTTTANSFQEKLTETHSDQFQGEAGGRDMNMITSTSQQGSDDGAHVGETKIVSPGYDFPSENGALEKPDMFSQGPTVGVSEDTTVSESAQHSEDKQSSLINNTNHQANISCTGDLGGQVTLEQDPNGNSSKAENADSGGIVNTNTSPAAAEGKQVASGSNTPNHPASEAPDQGGNLKEAGGAIGDGLVSAVVTGGAERGGLTSADVTAGMSGSRGEGPTAVVV